MEKTYEFEGKQYQFLCARKPVDGEIYEWCGRVYRATNCANFGIVHILTPIEAPPRVLTGYAADAKAGDVYNDGDAEWVLVEHRKYKRGEHYIGCSYGDDWAKVYREDVDCPDSCCRWIVVPHEPGEESKADATTDALTRISQRADGLKTILLSKHEDYGGSVYKTPRFVPQATPRDAMLIRLGDKVERLERLLGGNKANVNESVDDTLLDLAGYALLILAEKEIP